MNNKKVLLINWDCYPSQTSGGVYTWTKILIDTMSQWNFVVINQLSNPNTNNEYEIPPNVEKVIELPIFGTNRCEEFYNDERSFISKIIRTTDDVVTRQFIPLFSKFITLIILPNLNKNDLINCVCDLHDFLNVFDIKKCAEHPKTWDAFASTLCEDDMFKNMSLKEAWSVYQQLIRSLQILTIDISKVDIVHCSLAWLPSLLAIVAKKKYSVPVLITEHGVAFRELSLFYNAHIFDNESKFLWKTISNNIVSLLYSIADVITPVCNFNANWEKNFGVSDSKITVIYNGIDTNKFSPKSIHKQNSKPTIVCVSRIDIFKDIITTIKAIKFVKQRVPDIQCLIYGASKDLAYSQRCLDAIDELDLKDTVQFMGSTKEPEMAYNQADVVVMSSITEGFPFSIIEAMACKKPVISSDVGGVSEALNGCGVLVRPRQPLDLAKAIIHLLASQELRDSLGLKAINKVRKDFTLEKCAQLYEQEYRKLLDINNHPTISAKEVTLVE